MGDSFEWFRTLEEVNNILKDKKQNDLIKFTVNQKHRSLTKLDHYFEIYDRHFAKYRNREITLVEVGVQSGGSLQMWRDYFGTKARIIGIDIEKECMTLEQEGFEIYIGSQSDREFWREFKNKIQGIDIFIDDGGHTMDQQNVTFDEMFEAVKDGGVYLCEDLHTSYMEAWGGGYKKEDTFIEKCKNLIDDINAYNLDVPNLAENKFTNSIGGIHYYNSICVIEKRNTKAPVIVSIDTRQDIEMRDFLAEHKKIYIYGCGSIAENMLIRFGSLRKRAESFVISDGEVKPSHLKERPVVYLSELKLEKNDGIVIAVREKFCKEIISNIRKVGIDHIYPM